MYDSFAVNDTCGRTFIYLSYTCMVFGIGTHHKKHAPVSRLPHYHILCMLFDMSLL